MKILITGGNGSLGSRLAAPLVRRGDEVTLLDRSTGPRVRTPEFERCRVAVADIADADRVSEIVGEGGFDSIFHLAALMSSDAEENPEVAWQVNMIGTRNVLEAAHRHDVGRVLFTSTVASYGHMTEDPVPVDAPQWPESLYGATKVAGERLGVYYHRRFGVDFRGLWLVATVAPFGSTGGASGYCSQVYLDAVQEGTYEFYLEPATRAPIIYIGDAVGALIGLHDAPAADLTRRVYTLSGIAPSAEEFAASIRRVLPDTEFTYKPDPVLDAIVASWPDRYDDSASRADWGWAPGYDLDAITDAVIPALQAAIKG
ncbi:MAG: epimerase [Gemmatimonadaceae bacterium]|nr:epimerase [Gemmatimonadaceae bacterium]